MYLISCCSVSIVTFYTAKYLVKFKIFFTEHSLPMTGITSRCPPQECRHKLMSTSTSHLVPKRASSNDTKYNYIILHLRWMIHVGQPSDNLENFLPSNLMRMGSINICHFSSHCEIYHKIDLLLTY